MTLLHMCTEAEWRTMRDEGERRPPSLVAEGFVHCSTPEQVALPAQRLFADRDDIVLLVLDDQRLEAEIRWEQGVPTDPAAMRFPHVYGSIPLEAVVGVLSYRPGPDGYHRPDLSAAVRP